MDWQQPGADAKLPSGIIRPVHSIPWPYILFPVLQSILRWANQIAQTERERVHHGSGSIYPLSRQASDSNNVCNKENAYILRTQCRPFLSLFFFSLYNFCITPLRGKSWTERTTTVTIKKKPLDDRARQLNICSSPSFFLRAAVHSHAPMYAARRREPCQVQSQFWPFFDLFLGLSLGVFRP